MKCVCQRPSSWLKTALIFPLLFVVLIGWSISSPPGASPDDDYHLASSYCALGERAGLCESTKINNFRLIPSGLVSLQSCYSNQSASAGCINDHLRSSAEKMTISERLNTNNLYPKLFYFANGHLVGSDIQKSVTITRLFNIAVVILLFFLAYKFSHQRFREVIPATIAISSVPLGMFIFSSNNPSSWAIASLFSYSFLLASISRPLFSRGNLKLILPILTCLVIALGSRADSVLLILIITLGIFLFLLDGATISKRDLFALSPIVVIAALVFWILNPTLQKFVREGFLEGSTQVSGVDIFISNLLSLPQLLLGSFGFSLSEIPTRTGHLGWFNTPVPPTTSFITFSVYLILISLSFSSWKESEKRVIGFYILAFVALPLLIHQRDKTVIGQDIQPRYFFIFSFLILGFALVQKRFKKISPAMGILLVVAVSFAHSSALYVSIKRYTVGYGDFGLSLNSGVQWWYFKSVSPTAVWLITSLCYSLFLSLAFAKLRDTELQESLISKTRCDSQLLVLMKYREHDFL